MRSLWSRTLLVAGIVLMMFTASLIEVGLYAAAYLRFGAIEGVERAAYFSMVTFTTLGYGEIVLGEEWRMLASFEAANGIILFGWTTALIFAFIQYMIESRHAD
jgi:voltage-gated potassium channel Kch